MFLNDLRFASVVCINVGCQEKKIERLRKTKLVLAFEQFHEFIELLSVMPVMLLYLAGTWTGRSASCHRYFTFTGIFIKTVLQVNVSSEISDDMAIGGEKILKSEICSAVKAIR